MASPDVLVSQPTINDVYELPAASPISNASWRNSLSTTLRIPEEPKRLIYKPFRPLNRPGAVHPEPVEELTANAGMGVSCFDTAFCISYSKPCNSDDEFVVTKSFL